MTAHSPADTLAQTTEVAWTLTAPWAQVFSTAIVGAAVVYIAWRQWQTAKEKIAVDLFDKRFAVYEVLSEHYAPDFEEYAKTYSLVDVKTAVMSTYFLFDDDIAKAFVATYRYGLRPESSIEVNEAFRKMRSYMHFNQPIRPQRQSLRDRMRRRVHK